MYGNSKVSASEDANVNETFEGLKLKELTDSIHKMVEEERQKEEAHYAKYPTDRHKHFFFFTKYLDRVLTTDHKRGMNILKTVLTLPLAPLQVAVVIIGSTNHHRGHHDHHCHNDHYRHHSSRHHW